MSKASAHKLWTACFLLTDSSSTTSTRNHTEVSSGTLWSSSTSWKTTCGASFPLPQCWSSWTSLWICPTTTPTPTRSSSRGRGWTRCFGRTPKSISSWRFRFQFCTSIFYDAWTQRHKSLFVRLLWVIMMSELFRNSIEFFILIIVHKKKSSLMRIKYSLSRWHKP